MEPVRIIIVDDDLDVSGFMQKKLLREAPHFSITTIDSAEACLEYIAGNEVDCILSDYQMGGMSGMDLLVELRARGLDIPFIFVTGQGNEEVAREAFKNGAFDYFTKDIGFAHYTRIINSVEQAVSRRSVEKARAMAEDASRESESKYRMLFESNPLPMWVYDMETLRFLAVNDAAAGHYGYSREEFLGMTIKDIRPPGDVPALLEVVSNAPTGINKSGLWRHRIKGGTLIDVEITSHFVVFDGRRAKLVLANDVTERRRAEEELKKFKSIVDGAGEEVYMLDASGKVVYENEAAARSLGYTKEEMTGLNLSDFDAEHGNKFDEVAARLRVQDVPPYERVQITKDGRAVSREVKASYLNIGGKEYFIGFGRDITDRKNLERQRADFYAMVTHDLKAPLVSIMGYAELLLQDKKDEVDKETIEVAGSIRRSGRKLYRMVDDFLTLSRLEVGQAEIGGTRVDIARLARAVADEFAAMSEYKGTKLDMEIAKGLPVVIADRTLMQRAVSNMLHNAVNYTPAGGRIKIKAEAGKDGGVDSVIISVEDTGVGIPAGEREKVFEKYYRSAKTSGINGTGLGLSIVKAVAEAHGGRVELESEPGRGSTFRMVLPVKPAA